MTKFGAGPKPNGCMVENQGLNHSELPPNGMVSNTWNDWSKQAGAKLALGLVGLGFGGTLPTDAVVAMETVAIAPLNLAEEGISQEPRGLESEEPRQDPVLGAEGSDYFSGSPDVDWGLRAAPGDSIPPRSLESSVDLDSNDFRAWIESHRPSGPPEPSVWSMISMAVAAAGMWLFRGRSNKSSEDLPPEAAKPTEQDESERINPYAPPPSLAYLDKVES